MYVKSLEQPNTNFRGQRQCPPPLCCPVTTPQSIRAHGHRRQDELMQAAVYSAFETGLLGVEIKSCGSECGGEGLGSVWRKRFSGLAAGMGGWSRGSGPRGRAPQRRAGEWGRGEEEEEEEEGEGRPKRARFAMVIATHWLPAYAAPSRDQHGRSPMYPPHLVSPFYPAQPAFSPLRSQAYVPNFGLPPHLSLPSSSPIHHTLSNSTITFACQPLRDTETLLNDVFFTPPPSADREFFTPATFATEETDNSESGTENLSLSPPYSPDEAPDMYMFEFLENAVRAEKRSMEDWSDSESKRRRTDGEAEASLNPVKLSEESEVFGKSVEEEYLDELTFDAHLLPSDTAWTVPGEDEGLSVVGSASVGELHLESLESESEQEADAEEEEEDDEDEEAESEDAEASQPEKEDANVVRTVPSLLPVYNHPPSSSPESVPIRVDSRRKVPPRPTKLPNTLYSELTREKRDWCRYCGTTEGVNWRPGPWGKRTLCNKHGCDYKGYGFVCKLPRLDLTEFTHENIHDRERPVLQLFCYACHKRESWEGDVLVRCEGCPRAFHQSCCPSGRIPDEVVEGDEPWFCGDGCRENLEKRQVVVEVARRRLPLMSTPKDTPGTPQPPVVESGRRRYTRG
ncbi:uncharacterized protein VTP21DRAFT_2713 [Calcarisporiella thermophila]|uniref:uncharacterized protein n=1 Tax=Calcarisporiella thermophila TaxID=911321 RepID=UPI003744A46A